MTSMQSLASSSKKYIDDLDFDSVDDYLRIHYDESKKIYDRIEFHLSRHGDFEYSCEEGYDYLSNDSKILIDNDGWDAGYWEVYYRIQKEDSTNIFIFSENNPDGSDISDKLVIKIRNDSYNVIFNRPFNIVRILPDGEIINLFGRDRLPKELPDTVISDRTYKVREYVPFLCYTLSDTESFELEKSISYNQKFSVGWAKSKRRKIIVDKITKTESFLFETYRQFPETSLRFLSKIDLSIYSKEQLRIMRNEIFADYGYAFDDDILKWQYEQLGWYVEEDKDVQDDLSEIEIHNISLIKQIEDSN